MNPADLPLAGLDFALVRLNPDGSLDSTFGDGYVTTALAASSARDSIYALALQTIDGEPGEDLGNREQSPHVTHGRDGVRL